MAAINDLISQIQDKELRERIQHEVDKMAKQKKFGLVFEEHLPECTPLYDVPVKVGATVAKRTGKVNDIYRLVLYLKSEDYQALVDAKNQMERYIEINRGFASLKIQFDFNPMNIF